MFTGLRGLFQWLVHVLINRDRLLLLLLLLLFLLLLVNLTPPPAGLRAIKLAPPPQAARSTEYVITFLCFFPFRVPARPAESYDNISFPEIVKQSFSGRRRPLSKTFLLHLLLPPSLVKLTGENMGSAHETFMESHVRYKKAVARRTCAHSCADG